MFIWIILVLWTTISIVLLISSIINTRRTQGICDVFDNLIMDFGSGVNELEKIQRKQMKAIENLIKDLSNNVSSLTDTKRNLDNLNAIERNLNELSNVFKKVAVEFENPVKLETINTLETKVNDLKRLIMIDHRRKQKEAKKPKESKK